MDWVNHELVKGIQENVLGWSAITNKVMITQVVPCPENVGTYFERRRSVVGMSAWHAAGQGFDSWTRHVS